MKNIVVAILSLAIGFSISVFGIKFYLENDKDKVESNRKESIPKNIKASEMPDSIQESFESWTTYSKENIDLMSTFKALDENGEKIGKGIFLNLLRIGSYLPKKVEKVNEVYYQLIPLGKTTDEKIKKSIQSLATMANHYFSMEGKKLPDYNFVDLQGVSYNKENTKGKVLVLKCWFITCKTCVEEFPQLNELVDTYKDKNVVFVSLAFDEKDKLIEFLKTKTFKYATIPLQKDYMSKELKVKQYPTHLIVDSNGVILKMVNNVHTLTLELDRIMNQS